MQFTPIFSWQEMSVDVARKNGYHEKRCQWNSQTLIDSGEVEVAAFKSTPLEAQGSRRRRGKGKAAEVRLFFSGQPGWVCFRTGAELSRLLTRQTWSATKRGWCGAFVPSFLSWPATCKGMAFCLPEPPQNERRGWFLCAHLQKRHLRPYVKRLLFPPLHSSGGSNPAIFR
jgi:hypothetical protein